MLLLEQGQLSCGTTWHAAGLVGQLRASESGTRLVQYSTRAVRAARGRDRPVDRLPPLRRRHRGPDAGPADPAAADRGHRRGLPARVRADQPGAGGRALPDPAHRRPGRRDLAARRRPGQPDRPDRRAGPRRPRPGRHHPGADQGHRHHRPTAQRRHRRSYRTGRRRGRGSGQLRGPVGQSGRRDVRRHRTAALGRALLRGHRADRRGAPGLPRAARPGRLHLHQGGGRRPGGRRLRARRQALGRARLSCPTRSSSSCSARTGTTSRS